MVFIELKVGRVNFKANGFDITLFLLWGIDSVWKADVCEPFNVSSCERGGKW